MRPQPQQPRVDDRTPQTKKDKKASRAEGMLPLVWLSFDPDELPVELDGLPDQAPAVGLTETSQPVASQANHILADLVDTKEDVTIIDDNHWQVFPSIGEALKRAGFAEYSLAVAKSARHGKWAVGIAGQWKRREAVAKLALCVAIARDHEHVDALFDKWPDFHRFCAALDGAPADALPRKMSGADEREQCESRKRPKNKQKAARPHDGHDEQGPPGIPRDSPVWIKIPDEELVPEILEGMSPSALAVAYDGASKKALYSRGAEVLKLLAGEDKVDLHDDFDWKKFPSVGAALKRAAEKEECMCLAVCEQRNAWAVGIGSRVQARHSAAKVALATSLAMDVDADELPDLEAYPVFTDFLNEAGLAERPLDDPV
jgi:hypothetical protein